MSHRAASLVVLALALSCATLAPACTSGLGFGSPRAMNHPVDVAFACFDTSIPGTPQVRPLADCALFVDVPSNTRQPPINPALHMHALVTQSTRGEVGAVDLIARQVLDSDQSVPGYTFVPVGELPTRIVVPPHSPTCTYVASRGPIDGRSPGISIVDTRRFRAGAGLDHNPFPLYAPYVLPSAPSDMVLAPDEGSFWISLDALGVVVRVPIRGVCDLGPIDLVVPLDVDAVPPGVPIALTAPTPTPSPGHTVDLTRMCPVPSPPIGAPCSATVPCPTGLSCLPTPDGAGYCTITSACSMSPPCSCPSCPSGTACNVRFGTDPFGTSGCFGECVTDAQCFTGQQCWAGVCQPACGTDAHCGPNGTCTAGRCAPRSCTSTCPDPRAMTCAGTTCPILPAAVQGHLVPRPVAPRNPGPRTAVFDGFAHPAPVAIAFDAPNGLLLVADRAQPLIHRIRMSDGTLDTPIATGVPVRDVVVTPLVPDSYDIMRDPLAGTCPAVGGLHRTNGFVPVPTSQITFSRYIYAIDDTDGSVLAIEYSTPGAPGFGAVIPVDVDGSLRPDRIAIPVGARALQIITPQYDTTAVDPRFAPAGPEPCTPPLTGNPSGYGLCLPSDDAPRVPPTPSLLRGVFLVIATTDGSLRFVDVYDLDAPCRARAFGTTDAAMLSHDCQSPTVTGDGMLYIRRHRPRSQQLLTSFVTLATAPAVYFPGGGSQPLGNDGRASTSSGSTAADNVPTLASITCPDRLAQIWPDVTMDAIDHIVCSLVDPFAAIQETWSAAWQGAIPGTYTTSANPHLDGTRWAFDTRNDYCARGVIGAVDAANVPAAYPPGSPERLYGGDLLAITGVMTDAQLMNPICREAVGITQLGQPQLPILVPIDSAYTSPPGQRAPYSGRISVAAGTPLLERGAGFPRGPCDAPGGCAAGDTCNTTTTPHLCMHVPTIDDALTCFSAAPGGRRSGQMLLTVDVRSQGAYTVTGTRTGFLSRVVRDPASGRCVYDSTNGDGLLFGHAFNGHRYENTRIAFQPQIGAGQVAADLTEIRMVLSGGPTQLGLDLSLSPTGVRQMALPSHLRYSSEMWALYAIETERSGLVEMTLRPLAVTRTVYQ